MKLNTTLIRAIALAYGIEVDAKRQLVHGQKYYKYCIWQPNGAYVGGWYPSANMVRIDDTNCWSVESYINALEKHIFVEVNV